MTIERNFWADNDSQKNEEKGRVGMTKEGRFLPSPIQQSDGREGRERERKMAKIGFGMA